LQAQIPQLDMRTKSWTLKETEGVRMYTKEERKKAIKLYVMYDKCAADVIRELG